MWTQEAFDGVSATTGTMATMPSGQSTDPLGSSCPQTLTSRIFVFVPRYRLLFRRCGQLLHRHGRLAPRRPRPSGMSLHISISVDRDHGPDLFFPTRSAQIYAFFLTWRYSAFLTEYRKVSSPNQGTSPHRRHRTVGVAAADLLSLVHIVSSGFYA